MQQTQDTKPDTLKDPKDERTGIFELGSPLVLKESLPQAKVHTEKDHKSKDNVRKSIQEFQSFGQGTMEYLACRFDPDDTTIGVGAADGQVYLFPIGQQPEKSVSVLNACSVPGTPITCLRWRPHSGISKTKGILVTTCADGSVASWHVASGKLLHQIIEKDNQALCLDYNKDGSQFATAGKDRIVRVYDESTKSCVVEMTGGIWQHPGHSNRIFSLKFHPDDPSVILTGGWDDTVYFWDIRDGRSFGSIFGPAICGDAIDVRGSTLLTGSWRNKEQLELWDYSSRKKIRDIAWEPGYTTENAYIYSCQFSKKDDETIIAGCSNLNEVKIFDRKHDDKPFGKIGDLKKGVYSVDYANNSDLFAACGGDGHCHVIQINRSLVQE